MVTLPGLGALPDEPLAVTVGVFDGVHRGHSLVLAATVAAGVAHRAAPTVITFEPHPDAVIRGAPPCLLTDPAERIERIAAAGVRCVVLQPFDGELASWPAERFVAAIAHGGRLRALVMSPESAFGRDRGGTIEAMRELGSAGGFEVVEVAPLAVGGERVSSSTIRRAVESGRLSVVRRLLGRPYAVVGTIVAGDRRGRTLGYPTANFSFAEPVALPPDGVYAVRITWGGTAVLGPTDRADGVASLGIRPTFGAGARVLEVHLFDFDGDLYGQRMRVEFVRRQRGERRFRDAQELIAQMDRDAARARTLLATPSRSSDRARAGSPSRVLSGDRSEPRGRSGSPSYRR